MDMNEKFWLDELDYIQSVRPSAPGDSFNAEPGTFVSYCEMQAKSARLDGFYGIADLIFNHVYKNKGV